MTAWKTQLLENAAAIFGGAASSGEDREKLRELDAKIGELTVERDFSEGALRKFPGLNELDAARGKASSGRDSGFALAGPVL